MAMARAMLSNNAIRAWTVAMAMAIAMTTN